MTETHIPAASLVARVRAIDTGSEAPIVGVHFFATTPVFVLGEEALLFAGEMPKTVPVHGGGILTSAGDGKRIVTGGDDGRLVSTTLEGETTEVATDDRKRWIDQVALGPDGAVAWSAGKVAHVKTGKGEVKSFEAPSTVAGLAFAPKGFRVAVAHYNGVSFWFPNAAAKPDVLEWKGSHLAVTIHPEGKFIVTAMQESTLHGWRVADSKHMRMSGYSARVRSMSWSSGGQFLATSGSEQLILWPFDGKDGPMGRQPKILARDEVRVGVVACHPKNPVVAVGSVDGKVMLVRIDDGALILVREKDGDPVSAMTWDATGQVLAFGTEGGKAGVLVL